MAARSLSLLKAIRRLDPIVVREGGIIVRLSLASTTSLPRSAVDGKACFPSLDVQRRFYSSQEGSEAVLRDTVKQGVQVGLRNAFKDLNFEAGASSEVRFVVVREVVDAAVVDALKEANLYSDQLPVLFEEQEFIKLAVKQGFTEAVQEMEQRSTCQTPLQKGVFDTAIVGLKRDLELASKTTMQELKNGSDEKFESAMDSLTEKLNVFMRTYEDMFSVYEVVDVASRTDTTMEGDEPDQTNSTMEGGDADATKFTMEVAKADSTNIIK
ncbi:uncharacterized protein [Aegilops tauschii subsp. strangulata]|nr:uncharacterized protein LOC109753145 [Aegilops tauschii subsp. strangulata]